MNPAVTRKQDASAGDAVPVDSLPLPVLLRSELAHVVGPHMSHGPMRVNRARLRVLVLEATEFVREATPQNIMKAGLLIDQIAVLEFAEVQPLFEAIEARCPGLLATLPRAKQYIDHLNKAERMAAIFNPSSLERLVAALRDFQAEGEF
jgi:hypothetical protein